MRRPGGEQPAIDSGQLQNYGHEPPDGRVMKRRNRSFFGGHQPTTRSLFYPYHLVS
jgi:hypothetical protein